MAAMFSPCDQSDLSTNTINTDDMNVLRDMLHAQAGNVIRCLQAARAEDREYDGASMRMIFAHALNLAEACIDSIRGAEAECLQHLAKREPARIFAVIPPARRPTPGIRTGVPVTVSPAGAA